MIFQEYICQVLNNARCLYRTSHAYLLIVEKISRWKFKKRKCSYAKSYDLFIIFANEKILIMVCNCLVMLCMH